ncbi:hypothetical protein Tco_0738360 [Tanacetum coccineum]
MATMAKNVIAAGVENRPSVLEKGMYDSWKTQSWLYIKGNENGEMLLDSINKDVYVKHANQYEVCESSSSGVVTQQIIQSPPQQSYEPLVVPQQPPILPAQPDSGFIIPTFLPIDDSIASLNKAMIFLSSANSLRYPPINNQLRTSSNPRTQDII